MKSYFIYTNHPDLMQSRKPFFKNLQNDFEAKNRYASNPEDADILVINSYECVDQILKRKRKNPSQLFIHQVNAPEKSYKKIIGWRDDIVRFINCNVADATVFQSQWSQKENQHLLISCTPLSTIIPKAPDPLIFNTRQRTTLTSARKPRLIANNWSNHWRKGFETLQFLDEHLNFDKYDMTFVGKSPLKFNNIRHIQPVDSLEMASWLKQSDIYILAAPKNEACAEVLLEALHCGVPVIAVNATSNSEFIGKGGELFDDMSEIPKTIRKVLKKYTVYQKSIQNPRLSEIGDRYYQFMQLCEQEHKDKRKHLSRLQFLYLRCILLAWRIFGTIEDMRQT